jgi:ATP synthase E chain
MQLVWSFLAIGLVLGVEKRKWTEEEKKQLKKLHEMKAEMEKIEKMMEIDLPKQHSTLSKAAEKIEKSLNFNQQMSENPFVNPWWYGSAGFLLLVNGFILYFAEFSKFYGKVSWMAGIGFFIFSGAWMAYLNATTEIPKPEDL